MYPRSIVLLLVGSEFDHLFTNVICPSIQLGISPAFTCHWLKSYPKHQHSPSLRNQSVLYKHRKSVPFQPRWNQKSLAGELSSVDLFLEKTAPNAESKAVLGAAVARFRDA
jgi:hypothetical protein